MTKPTKWHVCPAKTHIYQPRHPPSLISLHCALNGSLRAQGFFKWTAKTLIRLDGCPGWPESLLGAHVRLLVLSWGSSIIILILKYQQLFIRAHGSKKQLSEERKQELFSIHGPRQANSVLIAYASSEGSGEPAHPRSLARTSAARSYKQWVKRNLQTESQIPGPSEWLGMRSWNLSWRNARRHKFAWRGPHDSNF